MMRGCRSDGELRAFVDDQLPVEMMVEVESHLVDCKACRERAAHLQAESGWVSARLAALAPGPEATLSTSRALARLSERKQSEPTWKERMVKMSGLVSRRWRPALIALALIVVVGVSLSFEPIRAAAEDFLSVFRVRQFAVIPIGEEQMERMEEIGALLDQNFFLGEPTVWREPEVQTAGSVTEAAGLVGFPVRTPEYLPDGFVSAEGVKVSTEGLASFEMDLESARALFEMVGLDPALLPDSLAEGPLEVTIPPMVTQLWKYQYRTGLTYIQAPSPTVDYPSDVDPAALASAALQLLGMDEREAERLSNTIDWTNTLVLPVPTDIVSFSEVAIDGTSGLLLTEEYDQRGSHSALMWQKDGVVHLLEANLGSDDLMEVALSIR